MRLIVELQCLLVQGAIEKHVYNMFTVKELKKKTEQFCYILI